MSSCEKCFKCIYHDMCYRHFQLGLFYKCPLETLNKKREN